MAIAAVVLAITIPLDFSGGRILTIIIGAVVALVLLANLFSLDDYLPDWLRPSKQHIGKALFIDGMLFLVLLLILSAEVFLLGPDLRQDGLHGFLAPKVLDLSARPVVLTDLNGTFDPMEALYLGGNADLYVLYDPCDEVVANGPRWLFTGGTYSASSVQPQMKLSIRPEYRFASASIVGCLRCRERRKVLEKSWRTRGC